LRRFHQNQKMSKKQTKASAALTLRDDFATAIEKNDFAMVKSLLENGEIDVNVRLPRDSRPPPLVLAAGVFRCDPKIIELLLNAGARIDDVDKLGQTACHGAARGHSEVLPLLLAQRPNLALKDKEGSTALQRAIASNCGIYASDFFAVQLMRAGAPLDDLDGNELCMLAASGTTAIQELMDRGFDLNDLRDEDGLTPLHLATHDCHLDILCKLIECGLDLEARSSTKICGTCTHCAIGGHHGDALRVLLLAGADVNAVNARGEPLLHYSVSLDRYMFSLLLLAAGADVAARDRTGRTACLLAAQEAPMYVDMMVAAGADLDAADENGETPRLRLAHRPVGVDPKRVDLARREIAQMRLEFVRERATMVCIGLQSLRLDALQMCEILVHACGPLAPLVTFHQWWMIVTTIKHFKSRKSLDVHKES
jgi:ankyrin repeat protein